MKLHQDSIQQWNTSLISKLLLSSMKIEDGQRMKLY